jgi:hypothetical protein
MVPSLHVLIGILLPLAAFASGIFNHRALSITGKVVVLQLLFATLAEIIGVRLTYLKIPNVSVFNIYMILEFLLLGLAPLFVLPEKRTRIAIIALLFVGLSFHIYNIATSGLDFFANKSVVLYGFIIAAVYFYTLVRNPGQPTDRRISPLSLICIAHIIYFVGCIPFFGLFHVVRSDYPGVFKGLFNINFILSILRYLLIAFSFYLWSDSKLKLSKVSSHDR